jgi:hypothetical protein
MLIRHMVRRNSNEQNIHSKTFFSLFVIDKRDGFDPLTALEKWVEIGKPPESIFTTKNDDAGKVLSTRPVCPYP